MEHRVAERIALRKDAIACDDEAIEKNREKIKLIQADIDYDLADIAKWKAQIAELEAGNEDNIPQ